MLSVRVSCDLSYEFKYTRSNHVTQLTRKQLEDISDDIGKVLFTHTGDDSYYYFYETCGILDSFNSLIEFIVKVIEYYFVLEYKTHMLDSDKNEICELLKEMFLYNNHINNPVYIDARLFSKYDFRLQIVLGMIIYVLGLYLNINCYSNTPEIIFGIVFGVRVLNTPFTVITNERELLIADNDVLKSHIHEIFGEELFYA